MALYEDPLKGLGLKQRDALGSERCITHQLFESRRAVLAEQTGLALLPHKYA